MQRIRLDPNRTCKAASPNNPGVLPHLKRDGRNGEEEKKKAEREAKRRVEVTCDIEGIEEFKACHAEV